MKSHECIALLLDNRVVVFDYNCANQIYWNGYYGTFLGVYKPRIENRDIKSPLELSIIEAVYLTKKRLLRVIKDKKILEYRELYEIGENKVNKFKALYEVYSDLREKGFVVRRGLKFGCDYLIYKYGPGIDHAPFGILVYVEDEIEDPVELVRAGRLLHSVRKKLIVAIVGNSEIKYLIFAWWKP